MTGLLLLVVATPLAELWFGDVSKLPPRLAELAATAALVGVLMPAYTTAQNWCQGRLVHSGRTRPVTEGMALNLALIAIGLWIGVELQPEVGIYYTLATYTVAGSAAAAWLWFRARRATARA